MYASKNSNSQIVYSLKEEDLNNKRGKIINQSSDNYWGVVNFNNQNNVEFGKQKMLLVNYRTSPHGDRAASIIPSTQQRPTNSWTASGSTFVSNKGEPLAPSGGSTWG